MVTVRERPARVHTGNLSPRSEVCGEKKRFNAISRLIFKAQKAANRRGLRDRTDAVASETALVGAESLPINSASLTLCMQWISAAQLPLGSLPARDL